MSKIKLIFDIDGVLIDTRRSYRWAIKRTVEYFLNQNVTLKEVDQLKQQAGFNNDWVAAHFLVNQKKKKIDFEDVKSVFQSIYLGSERYPEGPLKNQKGLYRKESLIFSRARLYSLLRQFGPLSIITGRTLEEARFVLRQFKIDDYFEDVISVEDHYARISSAEYPLLRAYGQDKSNPIFFFALSDIRQYEKIYYIGDNISDLMLVSRAQPYLPVESIYFINQLPAHRRAKTLQQAIEHQPTLIAYHSEDVVNWLKNIKNK
jgi:histidinol-phosphate aminotransferase